MFIKKAFTLIELIIVTSIIGIMTYAVSLGIGSFGTSTELYNSENLINSKIRLEKAGITSGEIQCSNINLNSENEYFTILNSEKDNNFCKKNYFGDIISIENRNIEMEIKSNYTGNKIEVLETGDKFGHLEHKIIHKLGTGTNIPFVSFKLKDSRSYKIIINNEGAREKEELEIVFFNINRYKIEKYDTRIITIKEIEGIDFRKNLVYGSKLDIMFQIPKSESKIYIDKKRVNDIKIGLLNGLGDKTNFNIFSY